MKHNNQLCFLLERVCVANSKILVYSEDNKWPIVSYPGNYDQSTSFDFSQTHSAIFSKTEKGTSMKFDWENWSVGGKIIFVAACVATASMLMKWVDIGLVSQTGLAQGAFLFLGFWVYPVLKLFKNEEIHQGWGLGCSISSVCCTIVYIGSKSVEAFGNSVNFAATGAYLFLFASIALIVGITKYEPAIIGADNAEQVADNAEQDGAADS